MAGDDFGFAPDPGLRPAYVVPSQGDGGGGLDFATLTIKEHYPAIMREDPESLIEASRGWWQIMGLLLATASNLTSAGDKLRHDWRPEKSQAAVAFFQHVGGTTYSLEEWSNAAAARAMALSVLAQAVQTAKANMEALWIEFDTKARLAQAQEKDNSWGKDIFRDIADWNGHRVDELLEEYTHRSMNEVVNPLANAYAAALGNLTNSSVFRGPKNAAKPSQAAMMGAFGGPPGMAGAPPGSPGAPPSSGGNAPTPVSGGPGAAPAALGPPPAAPGPPPAAPGPVPVAPAALDAPPAAPVPPPGGLAGQPLPEAPTIPAGALTAPSSPGAPGGASGLAFVPMLPPGAALGLGARPPASTVPAGLGAAGAPQGTTSPPPAMAPPPLSRPGGGPGLPPSLQGRAGGPPAVPPGLAGQPGRGAPPPTLPGRVGPGAPASPALPGRAGPGGPGYPALPGRGGGPGAPGFPGTGRTVPGGGTSPGRPGTGAPASPNGTGALRSLQGIRSRSPLGRPGVPSTQPKTPPPLGGRLQAARPGAPETAETIRHALRRGLAGRGLPEFRPGAGPTLSPNGRPDAKSSSPASSQHRDHAGASVSRADVNRAEVERVGDEELFTNDEKAPAIIEPPEARGPVKRPGPALGARP